jgi:hypothetical protein
MERLTPLLFTVIDPEMFAPLNVVAVPAYPRASKLSPALLTVHVTFDCVVFRPTASLLARAVVSALWLAVIAEPAEVPKLIPFRFENERVWNANPPFAAVTF